MADKKISQLTSASTPLTGSEELAIVQSGSTVKATAQDIADLGGGGSPFPLIVNPTTAVVNIVNALEGTSIPNGSTDNYTKTIPLGFSPSIALCVGLVSSFQGNLNVANPMTFGVASAIQTTVNTVPSLSDATGLIGKVETGVRILVTNNYLQAKRAQSIPTPIQSFGEMDETDTLLPVGHLLSYTQMNNNLIGFYNGPFTPAGAFGYSSSNIIEMQGHSILKSAYINGSNLVLLLKKRAATTGETWTRLEFRVYDLS
jgi:hypothetical protein